MFSRLDETTVREARSGLLAQTLRTCAPESAPYITAKKELERRARRQKGRLKGVVGAIIVLLGLLFLFARPTCGCIIF